jgi:hypothetical protein
MYPIEALRDRLASRFPDASVVMDEPMNRAGGHWYLDVRPGGGGPWIVVEWKATWGFGVSTPGEDDGFTKPDEIYPDEKAVFDRVVQLVLSGGRTEPPAPEKLEELKRAFYLSNAQAAGSTGREPAALASNEGATTPS